MQVVPCNSKTLSSPLKKKIKFMYVDYMSFFFFLQELHVFQLISFLIPIETLYLIGQNSFKISLLCIILLLLLNVSIIKSIKFHYNYKWHLLKPITWY